MQSPSSPVSPAPWQIRGGTRISYGTVPQVAFDSSLELLWTGDQFGYHSALQNPSGDGISWTTYSCFRHFKEPCVALSPVSIGPSESLMASASQTGLRICKPGGFCVLRKDFGANSLQKKIQHVQADASTRKVIISGESPVLLTMNLTEGREQDVVQVPFEGPLITTLKAADAYIVCGHSSGEVVLRTPQTLETAVSIKVGSTKILAANMKNDLVFCSTYQDRIASTVKVFDIRRPAEPLQTHSVAGLVINCLPYIRPSLAEEGKVSAVLLTSGQGFHVVTSGVSTAWSSGIFDPSVNSLSLTCCAVSRNQRHLILSTDSGGVYTFSDPANPEKTFFNSDTPAVAPQVKAVGRWAREVTIDTGFDYNADPETLASNWPPDNYMIGPPELRSRQFPASILSRLKLAEATHNFTGLTRADVYLPDPKDVLGGVLPDPYPFNDKLGDDPVEAPHILRELRKLYKTSTRARTGTASFYSKPDEANQVCYFSTSGFEWKAVNDSKNVVGLDNSYEEAWMNALFQCLYHVSAPYYPVRRAIMHHVCSKRYCVTCELGILFTNMQIQAQQNPPFPIVQPHNVLRTLKQIPEFVELGLFEKPKGRDDQVARMHNLQRKLLEVFDADIRAGCAEGRVPESLLFPEYSSIIVSLFGTELTLSKSTIAPQLHWDVPASATKVDEGLQHLLKKLEMYNAEPAIIRRLPPILVLLLNPEHGTLQPPSNLKFSRGKEEFNYVLNSSVIHLAWDQSDPGHFVNHIRSVHGDQFFIINDYYVSPPGKEDQLLAYIPALTSHSTVVAYYAFQEPKNLKFGTKNFDDRLPMHEVFPSLLRDDLFRMSIHQSKIPKTPIDCTLIPSLNEISPGDIVALDAEYVMLRWGNDRDELASMRRERTPLMTLARVSCILSKHAKDERTIMDDYVATPEPVLDYVTKFSGISEGDLSVEKSDRLLTALKATYLKLRILLNKGVRFLGHGLAQDFRVLNIAVPQSQIIDTVEIFRKPGGRKLRLRFLAHYLLGLSVQENEHDSIEDARTALLLFRKYEELLDAGEFEITLDMIMMRGGETNWQIPGDGLPSTSTGKMRGETPSPPPPPEFLSKPLSQTPLPAEDPNPTEMPDTFSAALEAAVPEIELLDDVVTKGDGNPQPKEDAKPAAEAQSSDSPQ